MNIKSGFAPVHGTQLYYEISGSGPPIVFLHGNPLDLRMWDSQAEEFAKNYMVLRFDFRGFGRSGNPGPEGYSHAEDLKTLLEYLHIKQVHLVGMSMGGGAAVNFAILFPEMTLSLTAVDSSLGGFKYSQGFLDALSSVAELVKEKGVQKAKEEFLKIPILHYAMKNEKAALKIFEMINSYGAWHWINRDTGKPLNPPAIERLYEIICPVLAIVGEYDTNDFHDITDILAEKIPNAKKVVMKGIGHMVNMEAPDEFNEILTGFLKDIII